MASRRVLVAPIAALIAIATFGSASWAQSPGRTMVEYRETKEMHVGEWHTLYRNPGSGALPQEDWRSWTLNVLRVGPIQLRAGDVLDVRLQHEFDTEAPGAGAWTIGGVQSEHWSRWTMASTSVYMAPSVVTSGGTRVMSAQEQNWDWFIHHLGISRAGYHEVRADCYCYVFDRVYFKSGLSFTDVAHRDVQINGNQYPGLQVAVFR